MYNRNLTVYNKNAAVAYAQKWALSSNPSYYNYDKIGGDCTNFASQCIFAGSHVMNYKKTFGWYYIGTNNHAPAWTGVAYLYNFLTRKSGIGPIGIDVPMEKVQPGDISQFAGATLQFSHTQVIVSVGETPSLENILICAHSDDSLNRALATYNFLKIRYVHIIGVN